ncbi:hypothetical protein FIBSPDRAFT_1040412 [Athelia psychrophila]|uniref:Cytochrome P450 n=1 Tax=Athelia psychrophila TaxID=1759441 RepID=A0A166Q9N3_9AGAM|nr:hypothetical protein FIBSPDRAFT_1040412 [Fibularhizoctonia sp. CBS 109695]
MICAHPEWKAPAIAEIQKLIQTRTNTTSTAPPHQCLSAIPISSWEHKMPVIECIVLNGTFLRRNKVPEVEVSGKNIPGSAFMAYNSADAHLNPEYYLESHKFDPSRFKLHWRSEQNGVPFLG